MFFDLETTGLDIVNDHILTIQKKDKYGKKVWCRRDYSTESELIEQFVNYYLSVKDKFLVGYNITNFDIPLLFSRMSREVLAKFFKKYNRGYVRDLAMISEFHKVKRQKMKDVAKIFQIDVHEIEDADVKVLYKQGDWDGVITYAERELDVIESLFLKMWAQIKEYGHLSFNFSSSV